MKRILALLLALVMILPLAACSSSLATENPTAEGEPSEKGENKNEEKGEIIYPDSFSAGFGREDMSPKNLPIKLGNGNTGDAMADSLYATCVAVCDGKTVALFFHMDMKEMPEDIFDSTTKRLQQKFGIPAENVIMTATHTHVAPHTTSDEANNIRWRSTLYEAAVNAAEQALRDLSPAKVSVGTGDATGMTFVRRYKMADGTYKMNPGKGDANIVEPESTPDPELRTIRFEREEGDDIVMANFQTHYCGDSKGITSDFVHYLRSDVEKNMGVHFAYFNGGSANINTANRLGESHYNTMSRLGAGLAKVVEESVSADKEVESGKIQVNQKDIEGEVRIDSEERRAQALEWSQTVGDSAKGEVLAKYKFDTQYEAIAVNARRKIAEGTETNLIPVSAISFGDVAMTANPFELFDISCKELREASPYKMTFTCSYSNAHQSYMPPDEIFPHGGYEVYVSRFVSGTAETTVNTIVSMLQENKAK
ncbi:MAG: hypothetical protein IKU24_02450 [Clostridia bacterium]|nr:hypothetical protein [Clostridia bacterium]